MNHRATQRLRNRLSALGDVAGRGGGLAQNYASDVQPEPRSRLALVPIALLVVVIVGLAVTAVVVVIRAGGSSSKADISRLTSDMLVDKKDVPKLTGATWETQLRNAESESPTPLKVSPPECVSPITKGARQIGTAQWTNGSDRLGVTLSVPTTNDKASLNRWVDSCSTFDVEGITKGSVKRLNLSGVPGWAVAYTLAIGLVPDTAPSAGIVGVHRGVTISAFYSAAAPEPATRNSLSKIFNTAVAKLDTA
jgi:hypothetical protein